jgi:hypothetical protein
MTSHHVALVPHGAEQDAPDVMTGPHHGKGEERDRANAAVIEQRY